MYKFILLVLFNLYSFSIIAQNNAKWLRYPSISPDGNTIAFGYMGHLYKIKTTGGEAVAMTTGSAHDMRPIWSNDGKVLAFSSNGNGNFDIYEMSALGGPANRLTFNAADDFAYDFTTDDKNILFGSGREAPAISVRFPSARLFQNLYTIPISGGSPVLLSAAGAEEAHYSPEGSKVVFQDRKGYEDPWRKHHTSAVTRDIWDYDIEKGVYTQLSTFNGENREPVYSPEGSSVYYLNEKDGTQNLYKMNPENKKEEQLTFFKDFPVRHLSIANDGTLAFSWKGDIYTIKEGEEAQKLNVVIVDNSGFAAIENMDINSVTEFAVSPNDKEIAFINRGEVFVTGVDDSRTKRITNTAEQERMVSWSPDGKTLIFSGEREGSWNVYKATLERPEEDYFYASTVVETEVLLSGTEEEFQAKYSPDAEKIAYIKDRNILAVKDIKSGKETIILPEGRNHSYSDGDWDYKWSPDSQYILVD
ncbi:MAG: peptidase S41, partial [Leeuwenhoekiella sp.]